MLIMGIGNSRRRFAPLVVVATRRAQGPTSLSHCATSIMGDVLEQSPALSHPATRYKKRGKHRQGKGAIYRTYSVPYWTTFFCLPLFFDSGLLSSDSVGVAAKCLFVCFRSRWAYLRHSSSSSSNIKRKYCTRHGSSPSPTHS